MHNLLAKFYLNFLEIRAIFSEPAEQLISSQVRDCGKDIVGNWWKKARSGLKSYRGMRGEEGKVGRQEGWLSNVTWGWEEQKWKEIKEAEGEDNGEGTRQIIRDNKKRASHGEEVTISLIGTTHKSIHSSRQHAKTAHFHF